MGTSDLEELTAEIIRSGMNIKNPPGCLLRLLEI